MNHRTGPRESQWHLPGENAEARLWQLTQIHLFHRKLTTGPIDGLGQWHLRPSHLPPFWHLISWSSQWSPENPKGQWQRPCIQVPPLLQVPGQHRKKEKGLPLMTQKFSRGEERGNREAGGLTWGGGQPRLCAHLSRSQSCPG